MATKFEILNDYAEIMAKTFVEHSAVLAVRDEKSYFNEATRYVSDIGLEKLSTIFGDVPMEQRAAVFSLFCEKLEQQGIVYDVGQFQATVH